MKNISLSQNSSLWFQETLEISSGRSVSIEYTRQLANKKSLFQTIEVYDTRACGRMLVLDGAIQLTEADHFAYHEMLVHVPLLTHPNPKRVLIVGGGDGGALAEVLKHSSVEEVVVCEIDAEVIEIAKEFFPCIAEGYKDSRTQVHIADAAEYIKKYKNAFDVICVDSSDPVGPAIVLFGAEFYHNLFQSLTVHGLVSAQSESMFYHRHFIQKFMQQNQTIFPYVNYYYTMVPTYPSGTIGFLLCSKSNPARTSLDESRIQALGTLQYYHCAMHQAAMVLPEFMKPI